MALWKNTQHSFSAGQLDALVMGRQDLEKYYSGATLLRNFLVKKQGCVSKRRGTDLIADLEGLNGVDANGDHIGEKAMRLIPVADSADSGRYIIVSGGIAYTANKNGVLCDDGSRVRKIAAYAATDSDGYTKTSYGKDGEANDDYPITVIHGNGNGEYTSFLYSQEQIQDALDKTIDGDRIVLHGDLIYLDKEKPEFRSETFTPSDGIASTFAFSDKYWRMTRSGTTYAATSSGRTVYVPQFKIGSVTATRTWTYAADGGHKNRSYKVARYNSTYWWCVTATDSATASGTESDLSVSFEIDGETITATRTGTDTAWTFTDGLAWSLSFAGSTWTATRTVGTAKQSDGESKQSNYCATTVTATVDGETITATSTWTYSDGGAWTPRVSTWLYFDCDGYASQRGATTYWGVDSFTFDKVVTATRDAKQVEFDLNGYDVRFVGDSYFCASAPNVGVTFKSSRKGGRVLVTSTNNCAAVMCKLTNPGSSRLGDFAFEKNIEWQMIGGTANVLIRVNYAKSVTFNGGTFKDTSTNDGVMGSTLSLSGCDAATFNGGTFDGGLETGCLVLVNPEMSKGIVMVNGGEFILKRPVSKNATCIFKTDYTKGYVINGGRFVCDGDSLFGSTKIGARGEVFYESTVKLVRGEFTASEMTSWKGEVHPLADFATDGSVANDETHDGYYGVKVEGETDYKWTGAIVEGIPYRVVVPYDDADIADLCVKQCGDTVFVTHQSYPPAKFWFDENGQHHYEELVFDNAEWDPPVIESAVFDGQEPKPVDPPTNDASNCPGWLTNTQKQERSEFYKNAQAKGTMTGAGFSGNEAESEDDGTMNKACTYNATVVEKDETSGKKVTHTYAISFTKTVTKEVTTQYTDGVASGSKTKTITTTGTAKNDASAAVVVVPRTIKYVATYVKDGRESLPSTPVLIDYEMPWANNAVVNITIAKGKNSEDPDYYNLYKDNGSGYGLVATTNDASALGGTSAKIDRYGTYVPVTSKTNGIDLVSVAEYESKKGWAAGTVAKKLASAPVGYYSTSTSGEVGIVIPKSMGEFTLTPPSGARFIQFALDARVIDGITGNTMLVFSQVAIRVTINFTRGGKEGSASSVFYPDVTTIHGAYAATLGVPKVMCSLGSETYVTSKGADILALNAGIGDTADILNECVRDVVIPNPLCGHEEVSIKDIKISFDYGYPWETYKEYRHQGAIRAIRFLSKTPRAIDNKTWKTTYNGYTTSSNNAITVVTGTDSDGNKIEVAYGYSSDGTSNVGGNLQDDYINPDMSVTPPVAPREPRFAAVGDFPRTIGLHDQRLILASTTSSPSTVWFSRISDFYSFEPHESVREDDAMELTLAATELPNINHIVDGREMLLLTDGGEWTVSPVTGNALTYKTTQMKLQSSVGSDLKLQPISIAEETVFGESGACGLRAIAYNYGSDSYKSSNLTLPAQSLFLGNRIVSMCYKQHPDSIIECVLADGRIATLVYDKENDVLAWSVHDFGDGWLARQVASPKSLSNGTTETAILVENASGKWQMWKVRDDDQTMTAKSQVVLDGLHEESYETPADGEVSVPLGDGTYAHGIPVVSEMVTVRPEPKQGDTLQMELKNATECEVRVANGSTFEMKPYAAKDGWRETVIEPERDGTKVTLCDADAKRIMTGMNTRDGRIHLRHTAPWPISVLSVSTTYQVEYENGGAK